MKIDLNLSEPIEMGAGMFMVDGKMPGNTYTAIGIDPGKNFGMTIINREYLQVYYGTLQVSKKPGVSGKMLHELIHKRLFYDRLVDVPENVVFRAVVEGAAYNFAKGQVFLEEIRFACYLGLANLGYTTEIIPPVTIRKMAFGRGTIKAQEIWPMLNPNGADSIGCALAALSLYEVDDAKK